MERHWEVLAPERLLDEAVQLAGVDRNAVRRDFPSSGPSEEATFQYPSAFCDEPTRFAMVLAHLVRRNTPITLIQVITDAATGAVLDYSRVYPRFDAQLMRLLDAFHPAAAASLAMLSDKAEAVVEHLRHASLPGYDDGAPHSGADS